MRTQWLPLVKPFGAQPPTLTTARAEGGMDPQHARRRPHSLIGKRGYAAVAGLVGLIGLVVIMVLGTLAQYASAGPGGSAQEENEWVTSSFSGEQGESAGESSDVVFTALVGGAAEERGHALEEESSSALTFLSDETLALALAEEETPELRAEADRRLARSLPDLSMMENGNLDSAVLCEIPWESYYTILCVTLPSLERLNEAFTVEFGTNLPIQSGYRTYDEQAMVHADAPYMTTLPGMSYHGWVWRSTSTLITTGVMTTRRWCGWWKTPPPTGGGIRPKNHSRQPSLNRGTSSSEPSTPAHRTGDFTGLFPR